MAIKGEIGRGGLGEALGKGSVERGGEGGGRGVERGLEGGSSLRSWRFEAAAIALFARTAWLL